MVTFVSCTKGRLKGRKNAIIEALISKGKEINAAQKFILAEIGWQMAFTFLKRCFPGFLVTDESLAIMAAKFTQHLQWGVSLS